MTYTASDHKEKVGDYVLCGDKPMNIGQDVSCSIELPESEEYEPQVYATILPVSGNDEWYIVRRTDCFDVKVNDKALLVATPLKNGDKLTFSDGKHTCCLKFTTHRDGDYNPEVGVLYKKHNRKDRVWREVEILVIFILGIGVIFNLVRKKEVSLKNVDLDKYNSSIYHITTDSVYLICDTVINGKQEQIVLERIGVNVVGTAFLTKDSMFVTARHCVEPWINDEKWDGTPDWTKISPEEALAIKAETRNRIGRTQRYKVRAHCIISLDLDWYEFYSDDFKMNKSRDLVLCLGSDGTPLYWRSIVPIAQRRDMELGDFAYVKSETACGELEMADYDDLMAFGSQSDKTICIMGYPEDDNNSQSLSVDYGQSQKLELDEITNTFPGCIRMSASINTGNSGGPVLAMINGSEVKVIGIVSKGDSRASQGTFWAVPITEVRDLYEKGGEIYSDTLIFRR